METDESKGEPVKPEPPQPQVKLEPGIAAAAPPAVAASTTALDSSNADDKNTSVPRFTQPFSTVYEPADLQASLHDIAEAGDVIRLVLNIPAAPTRPKEKPILPMRYELTIEGLRVLPTAEAPTFPTPLDMYRYGTAPKELVQEAAHRTRLTASVVPSVELTRNELTHWSELGRPSQLRQPILLPDTVLPGSEASESESESEGDDEELGEQAAQERDADRKAKKLWSPAKQSYRALVDHPQHDNAQSYFSLLARPLEEHEEAENEELERSSSSESEVEDVSRTHRKREHLGSFAVLKPTCSIPACSSLAVVLLLFVVVCSTRPNPSPVAPCLTTTILIHITAMSIRTRSRRANGRCRAAAVAMRSNSNHTGHNSTNMVAASRPLCDHHCSSSTIKIEVANRSASMDATRIRTRLRIAVRAAAAVVATTSNSRIPRSRVHRRANTIPAATFLAKPNPRATRQCRRTSMCSPKKCGRAAIRSV
jgi:hypothetical protein